MATPSSERQGFASRLIELCDEGKLALHGRQTRLAELFSVTPKAARKWIAGLGLPELELVIRIARWGNVNIEWLLTGRGPKRGNLVHTKDLILGEMMRSLPAATRHEVVDYLEYKIVRGVPSIAEEQRARYLAALGALDRDVSP